MWAKPLGWAYWIVAACLHGLVLVWMRPLGRYTLLLGGLNNTIDIILLGIEQYTITIRGWHWTTILGYSNVSWVKIGHQTISELAHSRFRIILLELGLNKVEIGWVVTPVG